MPADFSVANSPVLTSGTIAVTWANVADGTWFGNNTGGSAVPAFHTSAITVINGAATSSIKDHDRHD